MIRAQAPEPASVPEATVDTRPLGLAAMTTQSSDTFRTAIGSEPSGDPEDACAPNAACERHLPDERIEGA